MEHVEFDKEQLMAALRSGLDINDCTQEEIDNLTLQKKEEFVDEANRLSKTRKEELYDEQNRIDAAYDLSALGAVRKIGDLDISCVLGNIVLLSIIDSPLTSGKLGDNIGFEDIVKALYVLYFGRDALEPIMNINESVQDLNIFKPLCKDNPEMCDRVMKKYDELRNARKNFTNEAIDFYEAHFTGDQLQEVFDKLFAIINDMIKSVEELETSDKNSNTKKK